MYSSDTLGSLALYDSADAGYRVIRVLANTVHHGDLHGPCALTISPDGLRLAFVGPTQYTVSVVDGKSLDEVYIFFYFFLWVPLYYWREFIAKVHTYNIVV